MKHITVQKLSRVIYVCIPIDKLNTVTRGYQDPQSPE